MRDDSRGGEEVERRGGGEGREGWEGGDILGTGGAEASERKDVGATRSDCSERNQVRGGRRVGRELDGRAGGRRGKRGRREGGQRGRKGGEGAVKEVGDWK